MPNEQLGQTDMKGRYYRFCSGLGQRVGNKKEPHTWTGAGLSCKQQNSDQLLTEI